MLCSAGAAIVMDGLHALVEPGMRAPSRTYWPFWPRARPVSQAERLSRFATRQNVVASGPVGRRGPRSNARVETPAWARRKAVTPPPKPVPTTTARSRSSVTAGEVETCVSVVLPRRPPRRVRSRRVVCGG
ncbi:hypothetical protein [Streptomyces prunicolor]|uniref:Uncharacterized protein n=1 Tax=Streptomyces prunicolor TaxID=67348 RepID=A0ABU4F7J6_9ACTN|nr:hypothetical protein [Streptomyces prunicolor]MDV7216568.1 hypothetical protein [Streptomyces prunicolor]